MDRFFCKELPKNRKKPSQVVNRKKNKKSVVKSNEDIFGKTFTLSKDKPQSYLDFGQVCTCNLYRELINKKKSDTNIYIFTSNYMFNHRNHLENLSHVRNVKCCMCWEWKKMKRIIANIVEVNNTCILIVYQYNLCDMSGSHVSEVGAAVLTVHAAARIDPATAAPWERRINILK